ncbi:zinc finger CCCH domain-containing protein 2-like [Gastrolobium bilobum]|uniref:zinc finger CCCH domain-containing protein 2-like n=1 Tax=Gastrolobium bilobum TaxID=150636 RepID=UPI002AB10ACE|nr:zinc finger CCCH domain-containing protein 2-like [Gastrolobium bilobum]
MSNVCAEQHHKFQHTHQLLSLKKSLRDIDIPPRKLLTRRAAAVHDVAGAGDIFSDETLMQKYLPHNNPVDSDEDSDDPYSSDHFRMYEFKVRRCTRSRSHDWTDCPFAHPGEKARRRDPRRYHYSGTVCPEYRRGGCSRGDSCEFSHGVFECWLHPARYRTEACKDGKNCKRKVCFFAHTTRQLRVLPVNNSHDMFSCNNNNNNNNKSKFLNPSSGSNHCCLFCHCSNSTTSASVNASSTYSPTSTLFGMSHFSSPPLSPSSNSPSSTCHSPSVSRFVGSETCGGGGMNHHGVVSYKDVLTEFMCSLEKLSFGEASNSPVSNWVDVSFNSEDQHQFFIVLPTTVASGNFSNGKYSTSCKFLREEKRVVVDDVTAPDLGWVNDLLM